MTGSGRTARGGSRAGPPRAVGPARRRAGANEGERGIEGERASPERGRGGREREREGGRGRGRKLDGESVRKSVRKSVRVRVSEIEIEIDR